MSNEITIKNGNIFLKKLSPINAINLEHRIYSVADSILPDYKGGQWQFVITHSGARYMRFPFEGKLELSFVQNEAQLGSDAAGIAMSLIAMSHFAFHLHEKGSPDTDNVSEMFYELRDYALTHAEMQGIFALID